MKNLKELQSTLHNFKKQNIEYKSNPIDPIGIIVFVVDFLIALVDNFVSDPDNQKP